MQLVTKDQKFEVGTIFDSQEARMAKGSSNPAADF